MPRLSRPLLKRLFLIPVVLCGFLFLVLWIVAGNIASPDRRDLQDYHRAYLDDPAGHGVLISKHSFRDGKVPTLVVRPDRKSGPAKRGLLVREQLEKRGVVLPAFGAETGLVVLLHGRNGRKEDLLPVAERFCAVGLVCVLPDLPSHGESPLETVGFGARDFEKNLAGGVADAAKEALNLDVVPQFLWGMSMGGSFAIHAAAQEPERWKRMTIVSSFDTLGGVIGDSRGGLFRGILIPMIKARGGPEVEKVTPVNLAARLTLPTLVVHGSADDFIRESRGKALFEAFGGEKKYMEVPGGTHSNVLITEAPVYATMAEWLLGE